MKLRSTKDFKVKKGLAIVDLLGRYHDALQAARDHAVEAMACVPLIKQEEIAV